MGGLPMLPSTRRRIAERPLRSRLLRAGAVSIFALAPVVGVVGPVASSAGAVVPQLPRVDTDGDGLLNRSLLELDIDNDGLLDGDPAENDVDGDGLTDDDLQEE